MYAYIPMYLYLLGHSCVNVLANVDKLFPLDNVINFLFDYDLLFPKKINHLLGYYFYESV